ncbi:MAG: hypothetical protein HN948_06685 [Clostridia bacterium]|jgi:hypothetical protein|nr:hypothetical protein [Clostridia bacterium]MBT7122679.1 hypothetical protein [Clostridia bacterium]
MRAKHIIIPLIILLVIATLVSCAPQDRTGASEADSAVPKQSAASATHSPTAKPSPSPTQADVFSLSMERSRYPLNWNIIAFTLYVPKGEKAFGSDTPGLEWRTAGEWVYMPIMYKCGLMESFEDGERLTVNLNNLRDLQAGQYRVYLDVSSEMDGENPTRLYAYFSLTQGTVAFAQPSKYVKGTDKIIIVLDNSQDVGRVELGEIHIQKQEGHDTYGCGAGVVDGSVVLEQDEILELEVGLEKAFVLPGVYLAEIWLTRSQWGGEPFTEHRLVMFTIE